MLKKTAALVIALALSIVAGCAAGEDPSAKTNPASPSVDAVDVSSAEFQAKWWTWAAAPEDVNPVMDSTGEHCAQGQPGDVWLVAGSFGGAVERQCSVPAGLPIAGPVVNTVASDAADCKAFLEAATGTVSMENSPQLTQVEPVRFEFTAQAGNPSGFDPGPNEGYGCGIWFSAGPLPAGKHKIVIEGGSGDFAVKATYNVTVRGDGQRRSAA
ncbi:hypothetical protein GCM10009789_80870 [Kribbella sancticallisti]|uniref:Lipoprotein n=1 Tax=Kribbella sancticallisti TaxID=460087 RepID=A0ABN2EQC1_9ACTN